MSTLTASQLQQQYIAYFGRPGDPAGINFWLSSGITEREFADNIYAQDEYKTSTVGTKSTEEQVNQLYLNLFGRSADAEGLLYWTGQIENGTLSLSNIALDLIYSANTISHIKNLDDVFKSINLVLSNEGVLIIEDPSLLECLKRNTYDQFYNEHIYVFSYIALENILKKHKLKIFRIENLDIHGGSNRYFIKKSNSNRKIEKSVKKQKKKEIFYGLNKKITFIKFSKRVQKSKDKLVSIFSKFKSQNKKIIGYGATAKSTTILNYCNINSSTIDYFLDTTKDKQNKYTPGTKIIIKKYNGSIDKSVDYVFLGAWNFKKEIFKKERKFIKSGGKFIIHTPYPKVI